MQLEEAIADALKVGKALCKFISRNDVGATGAHQCGFYLPKSAWRMFSQNGPVKGINHKSLVRINWPEHIITESVVTWYGQGTRKEYRLTRFGKNFPWLHESFVGSLLVLIPFSLSQFSAYVLETEEEIETLQASLGIEIYDEWGVFNKGLVKSETEDECLDRVFSGVIKPLDDFPTGQWMASRARDAVNECAGDQAKTSADDRLLKWIAAEYQLFRTLERKISLPSVRKKFGNIDEFITVAATVMNRRKSRAGHSLEHHVEELLRAEKLPFDRQARIDGKVKPDLLIPGKTAYDNVSYPASRLIVVGLKTTCKDRWRQILNEGRRVKEKHLLTLQAAISSDQLVEMREANVTLVVPKPYHKGYDASTGIRMLTVDGFINKVRELHGVEC
ncbi:MAG: type II restriction endonuclease [Nibricoccus sp.]